MADLPPAGERGWAADLLYGSEPSTAPPPENLSATNDAEFVGGGDAAEPIDLDSDELIVAAGTDDAADVVNARTKKTVVVMGASLALAAMGIVAALLTFNDSPSPAPARPAPTAATPVPTTAAVATDQDQAIPFTASANCPPGSTSAQTLTDMTSDSAWVCVRGAEGGRVDGQVLHVDLGRSYLLTAVSVTPGWVAKTPGGKDEWLQHRVVTRLQYVFNDEDRTVFTQDTGNTHGPVTVPLAKKVLASRVTVIVLQTSRPPASPVPSADPTAASQPGFVDSILGAGGAPLDPDTTTTTEPDPSGAADADPVDATFAMSALKFFGHQPN
jgi:hypothetical protein